MRVSMEDWTAESERSVTSRQVAERSRSERVSAFEDEEEAVDSFRVSRVL